ncbi:MAG: tRNA pseudouridine(55) synthase TruB [Patescibacteria group bacterium]|nr:tRNA pseudouridine(55) synthase TruB [Patescibacteria group bacterium]
MDSIFGIYKPAGPTSHDIIDRIRRITGIKKVGHAGTLDPLAKGVLVVGLGREATKQLAKVVTKEKEYLATVQLGEESTTDDAEGEKTKMAFDRFPIAEEVRAALEKFRGEILQTPPIYSAIKIKGRAAYKYARQGQAVRLEPRPVLIKKIELLDYNWPELKIKVVTGPGVYIRSLARDIGKNLSTGGYLKELERIRVGEYRKEGAISLRELENKFTKDFDQIKKDNH